MPGFEIIDAAERNAVDQLFNQGSVFFAHGFAGKRKRYCVREFEAALSDKFGVSHSCCVSSGTAAIKIALKALSVGPGDEVITQAFNFVATVEAIYDVGATPVIIGINDTLNMDPLELERAITCRTKAVMPVHMLGVPCEMFEINEICRKHNLPVVEDACESIGALYDDRLTGSLGDFGVFSFDFGKNITTGEGGAIFCSDPKNYEYIKAYHDHGHKNEIGVPRGLDGIAMPGFNYRMTEIGAAIGIVQLSKLDFIIDENLKRYRILEDKLSSLFEFRAIPSRATPSYDTLIFTVDCENLRAKVIETLNDLKFGTKNLPDAMRWHCASFWGHLFTDSHSDSVTDAYERLSKCIAIPIWLERSEDDYAELAAKLLSLKS